MDGFHKKSSIASEMKVRWAGFIKNRLTALVDKVHFAGCTQNRSIVKESSLGELYISYFVLYIIALPLNIFDFQFHFLINILIFHFYCTTSCFMNDKRRCWGSTFMQDSTIRIIRIL